MRGEAREGTYTETCLDVEGRVKCRMKRRVGEHTRARIADLEIEA